MSGTAGSSDGRRPCAIAGARAGQIAVRNSQRPRVTKAALAGERNTTENNIASASQTPP